MWYDVHCFKTQCGATVSGSIHLLHTNMPCADVSCRCPQPLPPTERFGDREGGYTRIKPEAVLRRGDATEMAIIELV